VIPFFFLFPPPEFLCGFHPSSPKEEMQQSQKKERNAAMINVTVGLFFYPIVYINVRSGSQMRICTGRCNHYVVIMHIYASQGYFGNLAGPVLTHFTDVHFTPRRSTFLLSWQVDLRSPPSPFRTSSATNLFRLLSSLAFEIPRTLRLCTSRTPPPSRLIRLW
jgi:hypothetical protein